MRFKLRRVLSARALLLLLGVGLVVDAVIRYPRPLAVRLPFYFPGDFQRYLGATLVVLWWWLERSEDDSSSDGEGRPGF